MSLLLLFNSNPAQRQTGPGAWRIEPSAVYAATPGQHVFVLALAPAGYGIQLVRYAILMDGSSQAAVPAGVDLVVSTQATPGTPTPVIVTQVRGGASSGPPPTGGCNYTVDPTALTSIGPVYGAQFDDCFVAQLLLDRPLETDAAGGTIQAIGLRINVSTTVHVRGYLEVEAVG